MPPAGRPRRRAQDVELLYRHFDFERSAAGVFEYWLAIQELWASQRWIHSTVIADAEQLAHAHRRPGLADRAPGRARRAGRRA